ncbi:MAG TPA: type IX secretion system sortase PorU, partial [Bacteroidales bacterium]|nr:type IX secretion system sortase PorU [Bacteroidales bacterium]
VRMKYLKQKGTARQLKYLLLFGDGSYENRTLPPANPNFIPTYQSQNSTVVVSSFTSDDFYGLLDDGEGEAEGSLDIGIGRLPVADTAQAGIQLEKIVSYLDNANMGDWKNIICLTADDEDGNTHMIDAEDLASGLETKNPEYNIDKIYLDAFKQSSSVSGESYPDVNKTINDRINSGCLIFNYVGHGSETGLAAERVVRIEDINSWNNAGRLPLFITATCEFSRFDDIELNVATREMTGKTSAGEMVLLRKNGGAIALMSTTRLVYSAPNHILNKNIFNYAFSRDSDGNTMGLGDIIRLAKNSSGNGSNKRNFTLLGDPALKLAYPRYGKVVTDSVNGVSVSADIDTLKALSVVTVSGHMEGTDGSLKDHFSGTVSPIVFDKETRVSTLGNDGGLTMDFYVRNNIVFSGKTMAENGRFRFTFIVPRDINYSFGNGKISYYASDGKEDMNGEFENVVVGGFADNVSGDTTGPDIKLYMNDTLFRDGGITDSNPELLAIISDSGGINATGSGIGHDITAWLDDDPSGAIVLNNYFDNEFDNYTKGKVIYNYTELSRGTHKLTLKAWDNFNNSSVNSVYFVVETGNKFILNNLLNYPNPFFGSTTITAEHNKPDTNLDILITIYNLVGKMIKIIKTSSPSSGYNLPPVTWDGNDDGGHRVARGIYPYVVTVTTSDGETARVSGRMIIL